MLTLCGFPISNYYNKVKMALLEKNIPFTEETVMTKSKDEAVLSVSPLAKIPFIRTPQGGLCESQAILEYLDAAYPNVPLLPADPFAAAKVRELIIFTELHLELVARELYGEAFFGGTITDEVKATVRPRLEKNIAGFKRLTKFSPYIAGDTFTQADCSAYVSLPLVGRATKAIYGEDLLLVGRATKAIYGEDLLLAGGVDCTAYLKLMGERASVQKVNADRKAALAPKA